MGCLSGSIDLNKGVCDCGGVVGFHLNSGAVQMICSVGKLNHLLLRIRNMEPNFSLQLLH